MLQVRRRSAPDRRRSDRSSSGCRATEGSRSAPRRSRRPPGAGPGGAVSACRPRDPAGSARPARDRPPIPTATSTMFAGARDVPKTSAVDGSIRRPGRGPAPRCSTLRVEVDDQHPMARLGCCGGQPEGHRGLADTALLVQQRRNTTHRGHRATWRGSRVTPATWADAACWRSQRVEWHPMSTL